MNDTIMLGGSKSLKECGQGLDKNKYVVVIGTNVLEIKSVVGIFDTHNEASNFILNYSLRGKANVITLTSEVGYEAQRKEHQGEDGMYIASERNNWYE